MYQKSFWIAANAENMVPMDQVPLAVLIDAKPDNNSILGIYTLILFEKKCIFLFHLLYSQTKF